MAIKLNQCDKMSDFESYVKSASLSYDKFYLKSILTFKNGKSIIANSTSLLNKYFDVVMQNITPVTLTDKHFLRYQFQPRLYSYEQLGSVELWALLLKINNMSTSLEFNRKTFNIPKQGTMIPLLNEILIRESHNIAVNNKEIASVK